MTTSLDQTPRFTMKVVSRRTGLSPHVIRAWERRYQVVSPQRTETNRRLYSEEDVSRLMLLSQATRFGHSIGQIAHLDREGLRRLMSEGSSLTSASPTPFGGGGTTVKQIFRDCLGAVKDLDSRKLEQALDHATVSLSQPALIDQVLTPLMTDIGEHWRSGSMRIANEHMASAVVRSFVGRRRNGYAPSGAAPHIVFTTPKGQLHELGALIATEVAVSEGCQVTFLGASLPATEIASAVETLKADILCLSIIYPPDDAELIDELQKLQTHLPGGVRLIVGGRASVAYSGVLESLNAILPNSLSEFRETLERLRQQ